MNTVSEELYCLSPDHNKETCQDERCDCDGFCTGMCRHRHISLPTNRTILKTVNGQVVVRPTAPESITVGRLLLVLNEEGRTAWNNGEDVIYPEHIDCIGDIHGLTKAEF